MSKVNAAEWTKAVSDGLDNFDNAERGVETSATDTLGGFSNLLLTTGPNPKSGAGSFTIFTISGSVLEDLTYTWESDANVQSVEQYRILVEQTAGDGFSALFLWNNGGAGFGETVNLGEELTVESAGVDCIRAGIADAAKLGNSTTALTDHVYLLDGNGNRITTGGGWADASAPQTFNATDTEFAYASTVSLTKNTSGSQTVDGVEVVYEETGNLIIKDTSSFNVTLNDGDTLELTTLKVNTTLP